jgi:hypothetical protein
MVSAAARRRGVIACEIRRASARAPVGPERAKYAAAAMIGDDQRACGIGRRDT